MLLSKLGHGLAVSAVGALAVTGMALVAAPASAVSTPDVAAPVVRLLSQHGGVASTRQDTRYYDGSVTLTAEVSVPGAEVSFEYNTDPAASDDSTGWTPISETVSGYDGFASAAWLPSSGVATSVALRAVAEVTGTDGGPVTSYSTRHDVLVAGPGDPTHAVALAPSSSSRYFAQPYADSGRTAHLLKVTGSTSATDGTVGLSVWNPADAAFQGQVDAAVQPTVFKVGMGSSYGPGGAFTDVLDIAAFDAGDGDVLAVRAERDSDDVQPLTLRSQTISSIVAVNRPDAGPTTTDVPLYVRDQDGAAVVGAEVRRASDAHLVGYTDDRGAVLATQPSDSTESYYANTTDADAFQDGTDVTTTVVVPAYVPSATATEVELADGDVFDDQEYADGDIALQVVDGRGDAYPSEQEVSYAVYPTGDEQPDLVTATTDEDGRVVLPFDPAGRDGSWTVAYTAPSSVGGQLQEPVTFVAGDAVLDLDPATASAPSGGALTFRGRLTVEGEALPGRDVDLAYARGTEQAPGTGADAGIVVGDERVLSGSATTGADGSFAVTVADAVEEGGPAEVGGRLDVTARGLGDTARATADFTASPVAPTPPATSTNTPTPIPTPIPAPSPSPAPDRGRVSIELSGADAGPAADRLRIDSSPAAAGEKVRVHVLTAGGWRVLRSVELDERGRASLTVRDRNGGRVTRYRVRLSPRPQLYAVTSASLRLR